MYVSSCNLPLNVIADCRLKTDGQLDDTEGGEHVLDLLSVGRNALGASTYTYCARITLFDYKASVAAQPEERKLARDLLRSHLKGHKIPRVSIVIPTSDISEDGDAQKADTIAWGAFGAPDSMANMRGCFFEWSPGRYVCPVYAPSGALKELQKWEMGHWFRRALRLGQSIQAGLEPDILMPAYIVSELAKSGSQATMLQALEQLRVHGRALAVDIESIEATGTITAIGISDGSVAVSVGWESYLPHGATEPEHGLLSGVPMIGEVSERVEELLRGAQRKIFHNHTFDVPRLESKGLKVGGAIDDTFAASAIAYPELRHGLQATCATCIPQAIPPWKSLWHPKIKGVSRDDIEYWTCDPKALRDYNARDAFYTWHLAAALLPQVGRAL